MSGPPSCTCVICGQTVLKAQTRHIGDGKRACKSHDGVEEKASAALEHLNAAKLAKTRIAGQRTQDKRAEWGQSGVTEAAAHWANKTCWTCGREGISLRDYYFRHLVWSERVRPDSTTDSERAPAISPVEVMVAHLTGKEVDVKEVRRALGLKEGQVVFNRIPLPKDVMVRGHILDCCAARRHHLDETAELVGLVQMCAEIQSSA